MSKRTRATSELLLVRFPNHHIPTKERAEEYAHSRIRGATLVEAGDQNGLEPYDMVKYRILETRVEIESEQPLQGRIIGICELLTKWASPL